MSESTPESNATPTETSPTDAPPVTKTFSQDELDRIVSERIQRERSKVSDYADLKAKADRLAELEESQKTEAQKIADRAAAAERKYDEARAEGLRYKAAAKHGVSEDYFDLLGSGDEETIATRAERVGSLIQVAAENERLKAELEALRAGRPSPTAGRPVEALRPGATPSDVVSEDAEYAQYAAALNLPTLRK